MRMDGSTLVPSDPPTPSSESQRRDLTGRASPAPAGDDRIGLGAAAGRKRSRGALLGPHGGGARTRVSSSAP
jgi:hypothetical protein